MNKLTKNELEELEELANADEEWSAAVAAYLHAIVEVGDYDYNLDIDVSGVNVKESINWDD